MTTSSDIAIREVSRTSSDDEYDTSLVPANPTSNPILFEGYLRKQAHNFGRDWSRRYFVLTPHALLYYHQPSEPVARCQIPLISASVKTVPAGEKLHMRRFKLLTPKREYLLEAETLEEAMEWVNSIQVAIEARILDSSSQQVPLSSGLIIGGRQLKEEITRIPGNEVCVDCSIPHPSWVSINLGVVLCIECSGIHRSLGCQISRVRSLEYDAFYPETIQVICLLGNARMNSVWEVENFACRKTLCATSYIEERKSYINDKYIQRAFTGDRTPMMSPISSPRGLATLFSPELEVFDAVQSEDVARTATLIFRYGIDINIRYGATGSTLLHMAASIGRILQAHFLLLNGIDALAKDGQGRIASEIALSSGYPELADHLARHQRISERGARTSVGSFDNNAKSMDECQALMMLRIREGFNNL